MEYILVCFFFSSRRRHTRWNCNWRSDVCSSDLPTAIAPGVDLEVRLAREHAAHVVVVGLLAEAADVGAGDDVVIAVGRCGVYGENLDLGVARSEERRVGKEGRWGGWLVQ